MATNKNKILKWVNAHKDEGDVELVSTNDGSAKLLKVSDKSLVDAGIPATLFTCGMKILFDNGETGKEFGYDFPCVQPVSARVSTSGKAQITLTLRILSAPTEISSL